MWAVYALLSAFFIATTDPIAKSILKGNVDECLVGWWMILLSTPFLAILYFSHPAPLNAALIKTILVVLPFEIAGAILYYKALKATDISLSVPFLALTPVFVLPISFLILGERMGTAGTLGVILIAAGAYSLNLKEARYGFVRPIRAIFINKGSFYMVLVALIFSVTAVISKKAMLHATPEAIPFIYNLSISLAMVPFVFYRLKKHPRDAQYDLRTVSSYIVLGLLSALSSIFYFKSVSMANVACAISIKRLSLIMSVGYGWLIFRERDIQIRLFSTVCMFLGVVLILTGK